MNVRCDFVLVFCMKSIKHSNVTVLILREKMISAMMTEKRKIETTTAEERKKITEQLKEDVIRLHIGCSDVAVQTDDKDEVRHDCMAH